MNRCWPVNELLVIAQYCEQSPQRAVWYLPKLSFRRATPNKNTIIQLILPIKIQILDGAVTYLTKYEFKYDR